MTDTPNPGSDEAAERGCLCPRFDNAKGRGAGGSEGEDAMFWIAPSCPLHGERETVRQAYTRNGDTR
ncbi:MAG: hypothetical protein FKY71_17830 [Spiribacter salinus]|uniref:Uncharacterized protein n=1 Tax=Spiribacter salinus TaxID=1335746 RepID=A0A540VBG7_9GAMM|nr:MAG: hypothetical protein FKY71_17830 [Spiribacter salinus]